MKITVLKSIFETDQTKCRFVSECERDFEKKLDYIAENIAKATENYCFFTLTGPSCSGKTTAAGKIVSALSIGNKRVKVISLDDFFLPRKYAHSEAVAKGIKVDYDSVSAMDIPLLRECVTDIANKRNTVLPKYSFEQGTAARTDSLASGEYDFFLFEGIQATYPEVRAILEPYGFYSTFIAPKTDIEIDGKLFTSNELRFFRRLVRDCKFRCSSLDFTFYYWNTVRENEINNIFPYECNQDIVIDSSLPYELFMIKPYAEEYFKTAKQGDRYYEQSIAELQKLRGIETISNKYLPENSMFHEFIG